jgi:hypothetical protein
MSRVRPLPGFPWGGPRKGRCGDGQGGGPESVTLAGRADRAHAARAFVSEVLGSGPPAEMTRSCWSAISSVIVSGTQTRVLPGRRPGPAMTRPGRGHRPSRTGNAGSEVVCGQAQAAGATDVMVGSVAGRRAMRSRP